MVHKEVVEFFLHSVTLQFITALEQLLSDVLGFLLKQCGFVFRQYTLWDIWCACPFLFKGSVYQHIVIFLGCKDLQQFYFQSWEVRVCGPKSASEGWVFLKDEYSVEVSSDETPHTIMFYHHINFLFSQSYFMCNSTNSRQFCGCWPLLFSWRQSMGL